MSLFQPGEAGACCFKPDQPEDKSEEVSFINKSRIFNYANFNIKGFIRNR